MNQNGRFSPWEEIEREVNETFACEHEQTKLTRVNCTNGAVQYRLQCQGCGQGVGKTSIPHRELSPSERDSAPEFDRSIYDSWMGRRHAMRELLWEQRKPERQAQYRNEVLDTPEWQAKRLLVMKRCRGICEGCGLLPATEVHHLTYDHRGDEFLWELVAVCRDCHERVEGVGAHEDSEAVPVPDLDEEDWSDDE